MGLGITSICASDLVPFKGSATGAVVAVTPDPGGVILTIHASGNATHLGNYQRIEQLLLNPATGAVQGTIDFRAANGDHLYVTFVGQFVSPTNAVGTYTFVGGTGRFAGATGSAQFDAFSPDGVNVSVDFAGTVSSVGG